MTAVRADLLRVVTQLQGSGLIGRPGEDPFPALANALGLSREEAEEVCERHGIALTSNGPTLVRHHGA